MRVVVFQGMIAKGWGPFIPGSEGEKALEEALWSSQICTATRCYL